MTRTTNFAAGAALLLALSGCVVATPANPYPPPPPPQAEAAPPPPPTAVMVWKPGHYHWNGAAYVWIRGHYVERVAGATHWEPGRWAFRGGAWVWVPGHWA